MTFARFSTDDVSGRMRGYVGEGAFTSDPLQTFGGIGVVEIPNLQGLLLHYICENGSSTMWRPTSRVPQCKRPRRATWLGDALAPRGGLTRKSRCPGASVDRRRCSHGRRRGRGGDDGGFTNSGTLDVDNIDNAVAGEIDGGSSLTITDTLANTGSVQVGNTDLTATTRAQPSRSDRGVRSPRSRRRRRRWRAAR
jgi:L-fucose isomerase, C-terminal domain